MQNSIIYTNNTIKATTKIPTKLNDMANMVIDKMKDILNAPTSDQIAKIDWSNVATIFATISIVLILAIICIIALYLLRAVGLYVMSKRKGNNFSWLAFVPFGCFFTYGFITGKTKIFGIEIDNAWALLPALLLSSCMPYVGCFSTLLFILVHYAMLYRIYQEKSPNFATVLLLLSIIIPILPPIVLFAIRNK